MQMKSCATMDCTCGGREAADVQRIKDEDEDEKERMLPGDQCTVRRRDRRRRNTPACTHTMPRYETHLHFAVSSTPVART